jgi:hypothetical protein
VNATDSRPLPAASPLALACLVLALAALALVAGLVRVPPLLDYPNHLARIELFAGDIYAAPLSSIYAQDWSGAATNIGVDLLAATLGRLIGGEGAGEAAPRRRAGAAAARRRSAQPGRLRGWHWWQVGFVLLAWNTTMLAGFLNFQVGLGLSLLAAARQLRHPSPGRAGGEPTALVLIGCALMVWHVFAVAFYGALVAGPRLRGVRQAGLPPAASRRGGGPSLRSACRSGSSCCSPRPCRAATRRPRRSTGWTDGYTLRNKLNVLRTAILTYDQAVDLAFILALALPVVVALARWAAARAEALRVHAGLAIAALGLAALAILVPSDVAGTGFVDWRMPIMAVLTAVAAIRPGLGRSPRLQAVAACALLVVALGRTGWHAAIWQERQEDIASVERTLSRVPVGAAVLPVEHRPPYGTPAPRGRYFYFSGISSGSHVPSLAVPWRQAFVPTLFATPGKQPLRVREPWQSFAAPEGLAAPVDYLTRFEETPETRYFYGFARNWQEHFDYVLVINADLPHRASEETPPELELVADEGFTKLYRTPRAARLAGGG